MLQFESPRMHDVIGIHTRYQLGARVTQAVIQCGDNAQSRPAQQADACIVTAKLPHKIRPGIHRSVINHE
jgi:hypothetical protein